MRRTLLVVFLVFVVAFQSACSTVPGIRWELTRYQDPETGHYHVFYVKHLPIVEDVYEVTQLVVGPIEGVWLKKPGGQPIADFENSDDALLAGIFMPPMLLLARILTEAQTKVLAGTVMHLLGLTGHAMGSVFKEEDNERFFEYGYGSFRTFMMHQTGGYTVGSTNADGQTRSRSLRPAGGITNSQIVAADGSVRTLPFSLMFYDLDVAGFIQAPNPEIDLLDRVEKLYELNEMRWRANSIFECFKKNPPDRTDHATLQILIPAGNLSEDAFQILFDETQAMYGHAPQDVRPDLGTLDGVREVITYQSISRVIGSPATATSRHFHGQPDILPDNNNKAFLINLGIFLPLVPSALNNHRVLYELQDGSRKRISPRPVSLYSMAEGIASEYDSAEQELMQGDTIPLLLRRDIEKLIPLFQETGVDKTDSESFNQVIRALR